MRTRLPLAVAGIALGLFGVFRLFTQIKVHDLIFLAIWLVGAVVIHDALLSPGVLGVGRLLHRLVRPRALRYVQGGLITTVCVVAIAVPMIYRAHSQPRVKALLEQNFALNLALVVAIIAAATTILYLFQVRRDRTRRQRSRNG